MSPTPSTTAPVNAPTSSLTSAWPRLQLRGISIDAMEPEWGTVETIIYQAMQNDINAELEFWKAWAAKRDKK